jgi:hypothetical protein
MAYDRHALQSSRETGFESSYLLSRQTLLPYPGS